MLGMLSKRARFVVSSKHDDDQTVALAEQQSGLHDDRHRRRHRRLPPRCGMLTLAVCVVLLVLLQLGNLKWWYRQSYQQQDKTTTMLPVSRTKDLMAHSYITMWLHQVHQWFGAEEERLQNAKQFISEAKEAGFGAIMTDLPWEWTEREAADQVDIHSFQKNWMGQVCEAGLKLHVVLTMREMPPWFDDNVDYREASSQNCRPESISSPISQPSPAHPYVWSRMLSYVQKATHLLVEAYGDCVLSISPTMNNEFETRFTQTHDLLRDYSAFAVVEFNDWRQRNNVPGSSGPPHLPCGSNCKATTDESTIAFLAFREEFLADRYEQLCRTAKQAASVNCLLHFGEMLATTDFFHSNPMMRLALSDAVDDLVMDSNMMLWGVAASPSVVGLMVSLARTYSNKVVHYELATERVLPCNSKGEFEAEQDIDIKQGSPLLIRTGVLNALEAGVHSIGVTNLCKPTRANTILPITEDTSLLQTSASFQPTAVIFVPHSVFYAYARAVTGTTCDVPAVPCWHESFADLVSFGFVKATNGTCPVDAAQKSVLDAWDDLRTRHKHVAVVADVDQLEPVASFARERVLIRFPCIMVEDGDWKFWQGGVVRKKYDAIHRKHPFTERINTWLC